MDDEIGKHLIKGNFLSREILFVALFHSKADQSSVVYN